MLFFVFFIFIIVVSVRLYFIFLVCIVDFYYVCGFEVEKWFGVELEGFDLVVEYDWGLLFFMVFSDGVYVLIEDFFYFMLLKFVEDGGVGILLFGILCIC